jgi:hypothetical protein
VVPVLILIFAGTIAVLVLRMPRPDALPVRVGACVEVSGIQQFSAGGAPLGIGHAKVVSCDGRHNGKITAKVSTMTDCPHGQSWLTDFGSTTYCVIAD